MSGAQVDGNADQLAAAWSATCSTTPTRHADSAVVVVARRKSSTAVRSRVADDGPGIPDADRERIFERFTRLDDARGRDDGGTGLGLAIVHDVVVAHGGSVAVENAPGAAFTVVLPVHAGI